METPLGWRFYLTIGISNVTVKWLTHSVHGVRDLVKLIIAQLVKQCPAFYGILRFITVFTLEPIMSQLNPVHVIIPSFF